jgi:hypothetical protein
MGQVIGASTFNDRAIAEAQSGTIKMDSRKALNEIWNLYLDDFGESGTYSCDGFTLSRETLLTPAHAAVIEAAKVAEMTLTSMAHAEALYGGQLADQVLDLLDAIKELRALEGDA